MFFDGWQGKWFVLYSGYNSRQKCTLGWFSPPSVVHSFICHFSTSRRSHEEGAISKAQ